MFNTNFTSVKQLLDLNKLTEAELVLHVKRYFENQNYRSSYNAKKNALLKTPEVKAMLKKMAGK